MKILFVFALVVVPVSLYSFSDEENISVGRFLIERLIHAPEAIDNIDKLGSKEIVVAYPTYESLFDVSIPIGNIGSAWTAEDKREAFEWFVRNLPTIEIGGRVKNVKRYGETALSFCFEYNVTNSTSLAMSVLSNPTNCCFGAAIPLFEKHLTPSDEITLFVENCVTNAEVKALDADYLASGYIAELRKQHNTLEPSVVTNGVHMALRLPVMCFTSKLTDMLLLELDPLYTSSSNRLVRANRVLEYLNRHQPFGADIARPYFENITNQLTGAILL